MEAIICAIYKDADDNLAEVKRFIFSHSGISQALIKHCAEEEAKCMPIIGAIAAVGYGKLVQKMLEDEFPH